MLEPSTRLSCLDSTGGRFVPLHDALADYASRTTKVSGPLDMFAPSVTADMVKAYVLAKLRGRSSVEVQVRSGEEHRFDMFDEVETLGCFVVTMGPPTGRSVDDDRQAVELPVRTTTYSLDVAGTIIDAHPDIERMLGWNPTELIGRSSLDIVHPDDHEKGILGWIDLLEQGAGGRCRMRQRFLTTSGTWRWLEDTTTNRLDDPDHGCVTCDLVDVADEVAALEEAERRDALLTRLTDALPTGVLHLGPERLPMFWNQRWMELLGRGSPSIDGLLGQVAEVDQVANAIERSYTEGRDTDVDVTLTNSATSSFARLRVRPIAHADGTAEVLITLEDTTADRKHQQELHDLAHRDSLTGLTSHVGLRPVVERLLDSDHEQRALLFVDLDSFKVINDTHGHATGDAVLQAAGRAISEATRSTDDVVRVGGDEFVVALADAASAAEADQMIERIHAALRAAEADFDLPLNISASIGLANVESTDSFDSLLRRADQAMYQIKRSKQQRASSV